jgi:hypothetical protein
VLHWAPTPRYSTASCGNKKLLMSLGRYPAAYFRTSRVLRASCFGQSWTCDPECSSITIPLRGDPRRHGGHDSDRRPGRPRPRDPGQRAEHGRGYCLRTGLAGRGRSSRPARVCAPAPRPVRGFHAGFSRNSCGGPDMSGTGAAGDWLAGVLAGAGPGMAGGRAALARPLWVWPSPPDFVNGQVAVALAQLS